MNKSYQHIRWLHRFGQHGPTTLLTSSLGYFTEKFSTGLFHTDEHRVHDYFLTRTSHIKLEV